MTSPSRSPHSPLSPRSSLSGTSSNSLKVIDINQSSPDRQDINRRMELINIIVSSILPDYNCQSYAVDKEPSLQLCVTSEEGDSKFEVLRSRKKLVKNVSGSSESSEEGASERRRGDVDRGDQEEQVLGDHR